MICQLERKDIQSIRKSNIVQQTGFWARVKRQQGAVPFAFKYKLSDDILSPENAGDQTVQDDLLILVTKISDSHCVAYVPYGPKDEPAPENQGLFLEELSEVLRSHLPSNCILIRFDLPWKSQWTGEGDFYDERGNWLGPPGVRSQELRVNFNTHHWNLVKSRSNVLPANTVFLNLKHDKEKILGLMKPKTRYNIRLSERKGVRVSRYGLDKLEVWYALYREAARRNQTTLHDLSYFQTVLATRSHDLAAPVHVYLLMADYNRDYLAAMFLVLSKNRATYLYGASTGARRNLMATYALQWEAIGLAKQAGCGEYDMFGAAPNPNPAHPMHGLYRFKTGFGGRLIHRMGCWDYPLDQEQYKIFRTHEMSCKRYHTN